MNGTFNVIRFEVMRNLKKPSFWIAAIMVPIILVAYVMICGMAGYSMGNTLSGNVDTTDMKLAVVDDSSYLQVYEIPKDEEGKETKTIEKLEDKERGIQEVKDKKIDVLYYLPADFEESGKVEIYVKPDKATMLDDYSAPLKTALSMQASTEVPPIDLKIITGAIDYTTTTYDAKDDHEVDFSETANKIVAPILGIALFYFLIVVLGNRIIVAMTEEKENRISELLLVSIKPTDLVAGKIVSLMILGIIQLLVLVIPLIIMVNTNAISTVLPAGFELKLDAFEIFKFGLFLIASYFLFTSACVAIGTITPTAKDANSYSGVIMIFMILLPFVFMNVFSIEPKFLTYFFTYFPFSAPLSVFFRGIFNNLPTWELWLALADILVTGAICTAIATYFFKRNAISFTSKINFKKLLGAPRKSWKQ
jgi:ABC-2 type transport system permease protein